MAILDIGILSGFKLDEKSHAKVSPTSGDDRNGLSISSFKFQFIRDFKAYEVKWILLAVSYSYSSSTSNSDFHVPVESNLSQSDYINENYTIKRNGFDKEVTFQ